MINSPKPWNLLSVKDVSVGEWMPIEARTYQKPDGNIVEDFTVTTLEDVSLIIPITPDKKIIMIKQFKPGAGEVTIEFPGGRLKPGENYLAGAKTELMEETGMMSEEFIELGETVTFPTKGSERIMNYLSLNTVKTSDQNLDEHEDIQILEFTPAEINQMIIVGEINTAPSITLWYLAKTKHPQYFK